ncbi:hypothetical protein VTH06DRAFT_1123 [Thermothelomyces fergusii]
MQYKIDTKIDK